MREYRKRSTQEQKEKHREQTKQKMIHYRAKQKQKQAERPTLRTRRAIKEEAGHQEKKVAREVARRQKTTEGENEAEPAEIEKT